MPRREHHGESFRYVIHYLREDVMQTRRVEINNWQQGRFELANQPTFTPFKFLVQAANNHGATYSNVAQWIRGYSGERGEYAAVD